MFSRVRNFLSSLSCGTLRSRRKSSQSNSKVPVERKEKSKDEKALEKFLLAHKINDQNAVNKQTLSCRTNSSDFMNFNQPNFGESYKEYENLTMKNEANFTISDDEELQKIINEAFDPEARQILTPEIPSSYIMTLKNGNNEKGGHGLVRQGKLYLISVKRTVNIFGKSKYRMDKQYIASKKSLNPNSLEELKILINEISIIKNCDHANILKYIGFVFLRPLNVYLITEFCDGMDLWQWLYQTNMWRSSSMCEIVHIASDLTNAVAYLHEKNILHRDIKSANSLLFTNKNKINPGNAGFVQKWIAKLADFGAAYSSEYGYSKATKNDYFKHAFTGNFESSAPEVQTDIEKPIQHNFKSDVFSLGIIYAELIIGNNPYDFLEREMIVELGRQGELYFEELIARYDTPTKMICLMWVCTDFDSNQRPLAKHCVKWMEEIKEKELKRYQNAEVHIDIDKMVQHKRSDFQDRLELAELQQKKDKIVSEMIEIGEMVKNINIDNFEEIDKFISDFKINA
ncbi:unnamed protein product [Brachionus calyciflorus]|uniref:Protein kinase domain-containing protein n=1 Tax=Brachionus calyciflorus TaxID=104777 RepID=A0A813LY90_9BILA|nr:unnamed protein product [Brachionus calyciflorus]